MNSRAEVFRKISECVQELENSSIALAFLLLEVSENRYWEDDFDRFKDWLEETHSQISLRTAQALISVARSSVRASQQMVTNSHLN